MPPILCWYAPFGDATSVPAINRLWEQVGLTRYLERFAPPDPEPRFSRADLIIRPSKLTTKSSWRSRDMTPSGSAVRCKPRNTEVARIVNIRNSKHSLELPHHDVVSGMDQVRR